MKLVVVPQRCGSSSAADEPISQHRQNSSLAVFIGYPDLVLSLGTCSTDPRGGQVMAIRWVYSPSRW